MKKYYDVYEVWDDGTEKFFWRFASKKKAQECMYQRGSQNRENYEFGIGAHIYTVVHCVVSTNPHFRQSDDKRVW